MANCKHFGQCGGCVHLDIPYSEELAKKEKALRETLAPHGHLLEAMLPAPSPNAYRNKMEFAFGDESKGGKLAVGIRKRRSFYEVATLEDCALVPDDFKKIALCVQEYFRQSGEAFFHRKRHTGSLRHLVLRRGEFTGEVLINLSATSGLGTDLAPLITQLLGLNLDGNIVGILHSVNDGVADTVKDEDIRILWGQDFFREHICGLDFIVSAFSFFQTNSAGAQVLYGVVKDMALQSADGYTSLAYDLYCGTGTIAQVLSPYFDKVIGVELNPAAIEAAKENAEINKITNCEFIAGDVLALLNQEEVMPGVTVIDPPRDGLHPKALAKLIALAPPRLVYVACKPTSLARDLVALTAAGYKPVRVIGVDMFPRTPHVEAIMLLCRTNT
ncbi:MAG: 23S rRNA (uracil(1939)-C(5))-methyltransferase RlmD [Defluviitaleaceae bacterium]|nr:23S rRNA (uracil(1939)-C(5))-methyltransferase RlmD [Defluviitaleaceae bacterium]